MPSGGSAPTEQNVTTTTSNLPEYARPYYENVVNRAQAQSYNDYTPYPNDRIAGFTPAQEQIQQNTLGLQAPNQIGYGSGLAAAAGLGSLASADYAPTQFSAQQIGLPSLQQYQMQGPMAVGAQSYTAPQMGGVSNVTGGGQITSQAIKAAQTNYRPDLTTYQMEGAPGEFGSVQAQQYMSPYVQNVLDIQKREALTDAQKAQLVQNLGAARQGTYGGARQLLATTQREQNLQQLMGDIEAKGLQSSYENAQAQFERDRAARTGYAEKNLGAKLGVQELSAGQQLQTALANLSADQQSRVANQASALQAAGMSADNALRASIANQQASLTVGQQNLAASLQTQGMNADQAMRAALANQQAGLTVGQQNLGAAMDTQRLGVTAGLDALRANQSAALDAQRLAEQSNQFSAANALAGYGQAGQMAQTLGALGQYQQQSDLQRLQAQSAVAGQGQALEQQQLDQMYADFLRQRDYPMEQLGYFNNILRGLPVGLSTTQTSYAPPPSMAQQVLGTGLGALGVANTLRG
jgi:hypothetical protein